MAAAVQGLCQPVHLVPGPAEDHRCRWRFQVEHSCQRGGLVPARHDVGGLPHLQGVIGLRCLAVELDPNRVAQVATDHAVDPRRHGRREQRGLPAVPGVGEDGLDVLREAHVEHLVGLVEHDDLEVAQVQRSPVEVVERTPWCRHDDVGAALERPELAADWLAAVYRQHARAHVAPVAVHRLGDLDREFAGWHEHQGEGLCPALALPEEPLQHRKRERRRLPGSRRGLPDQVAAREQGRDGGPLNRGGFLVAEAGKRLTQFRGQGQVGEAACTLAVAHGHEKITLLQKTLTPALVARARPG